MRSWSRSRAALQLEVLALRHQLQVLNRSRPRRLRLAMADRSALGVAVPLVARLANGTRHRQTANRHRLATSGPPPVVDVEKSKTSRATDGLGGRTRAHSDDVGAELATCRVTG